MDRSSLHPLPRRADLQTLQGAGWGYPIRMVAYAATALVVCQTVYLLVQQHGIAVVADENGPVEIAQALMACFSAGCLFFAAWRNQFGRPGIVFFACMVGYAAARECDGWFESILFDDAYKYVAGIPLATLAMLEVWRGRHRIISESFLLLKCPAFTIFVFAGIYVCSFCQMLDRPDLWTAIGEGPAAESTKAAVEEFAELFGYLMLAFSGIESVVLANQLRQRLETTNEADTAPGEANTEQGKTPAVLKAA